MDENIAKQEVENKMTVAKTSRRTNSYCTVLLALAVAVSFLAMLGVILMSILPQQTVVQGVQVAQLTPSQLQASYRSDTHHVQATTTNISMEVLLSPHGYYGIGGSAAMLSSEGRTIHGYDAAIVEMSGKMFVTILSKYKKKVRVQVHGDKTKLHQEVEPHKLQQMHEEHPSIVPEVVAANAAYAKAQGEVFALNTPAMKSFVDMAWSMGSEHGITGAEYPHMLTLYTTALETAKAYDYFPIEQGSKDYMEETGKEHRQLQLWGSGGGPSCADNTCGSSGQCSGRDCRGMCGPSCTCLKWICNSCCWMNFCKTHDDCCARYSFTQGPCFAVLENYARKVNGGHGLDCSANYNCDGIMSEGNAGGH